MAAAQDWNAILEREMKKTERMIARAEKAAKKPKLSPVAIANDRMRTAYGMYGRWVVTQGFQALTTEQQSQVRETIETFTDFTPGNDPYGEHDFGKLTVDGIDIFWKIDYYDPTFSMGLDPSDPNVRRVLTIMLANEW
jgi:hypothetical protein